MVSKQLRQNVPYKAENWHALKMNKIFWNTVFFRYLSMCLYKNQSIAL